jgi:AcrR family transcriptional regulator
MWAMDQSISKASKIAEKERLIVAAARDHFLRDGFAVASMDAIARTAEVSVKTIYSHFANKDELFSKVMIAACTDNLLSSETPSDQVLRERFPWFREATRKGLTEAGHIYLGHLLLPEQLALYRVVTRDADRFPELGRHYQKNIAAGRTGILGAYLRSIVAKHGLPARDSWEDAAVYEALLRAGIFERALHGLFIITPERIATQAASAAKTMWKLLHA